MIFVVIILAVLCLAYANGANDNLKGVATLLGSGTTNYRGAVVWATVTTLLGSLTAVFLAGTLLKSFSGKGLVADHLVADPSYGAAVALGAGLTVLLATRLGMPISTTHSLVGALVGAGWAAGSTIDVARLGQGFFVPLLLSPPLAILATIVCYVTFRGARRGLGISEQTCFCVGNQVIETRFKNSGLTCFQDCHFFFINVDTCYVITHFCKTRPRYEANVSSPYNSNFHLRAYRLKAYRFIAYEVSLIVRRVAATRQTTNFRYLPPS